jgi:hypothetical protein
LALPVPTAFPYAVLRGIKLPLEYGNLPQRLLVPKGPAQAPGVIVCGTIFPALSAIENEVMVVTAVPPVNAFVNTAP